VQYAQHSRIAVDEEGPLGLKAELAAKMTTGAPDNGEMVGLGYCCPETSKVCLDLRRSSGFSGGPTP
jgi:hypothetical protein